MLSTDYIPLPFSLWKRWAEFSFMLTEWVFLFLEISHAVCITLPLRALAFISFSKLEGDALVAISAALTFAYQQSLVGCVRLRQPIYRSWLLSL